MPAPGAVVDEFRGLGHGGQPPPAWGYEQASPVDRTRWRMPERQDSFAYRINTVFRLRALGLQAGHYKDGFWRCQLTAPPHRVPVPTPEVVAARDILRPFGVDRVQVSEGETIPEPLANRIVPSTTRALKRYVLRALGSRIFDEYLTAAVYRPPAARVSIRVPAPAYGPYAYPDPAEDVYGQHDYRLPYLGAPDPQPIEMPPMQWPVAMVQRAAAETATLDQRVKAAAKADELLRSHLDAEQIADWDQHQGFYVRSEFGRTYRVKGGLHSAVERLNADDQVVRRYCITLGAWPLGDVVLSKLLLLKFDEETFLHRANRLGEPTL